MPTRVLMVCQGNICRSPMAEALLRARVAGVQVGSAGIAALVGAPADPLAQAVMREKGIDLSSHRARQLTPELIAHVDLVLVMESAQLRMIERHAPAARGKVQRLGRFGDFDIPDPYGDGREAFEQAYERIARGVTDFERHLLGSPPDGA